MEFRILGPLEVLENGRRLELGGAKQRALLAILLLHANEVVSTDRLIDALWEEAAPESGRKALQVYVSGLRKALGKERLRTQAPGYLLHVLPDELDRERFERLVNDGQLGEALALWRGPVLQEFAYQRFAAGEIERIEELRIACLEQRIDQDLEAGRHAALVGELEALVREHPLRERLRGQLMLALYRSGRQAEALAAYQDARRALVDELGIEPSRSLRELQQEILEQSPALDVETPDERARKAPSDSTRPAPQPRARGERKTITALHVLIQPEPAHQLDPEVLRTVQTRAFAAITAAIEAHEGTIEAVSADAVSGVFGLPVVHEDDALRAARAADEVRSRLEQITEEASVVSNARLDIRIGVSTGQVMTGGATASRLRATGEPLTLAALLAHDAEPGDVIFDEATRRALEGRRGAGRFTSPMVGRERERRRLHDAFEQAVGDRSCQLFTILGTAGVGKSRLVEEFLGELGDRALVARGRCLPYGEGITFWPVLEVIKDMAGLDDTATPRDAQSRLAELIEDEREAEVLARRVTEVIGLTEATTGVEEGAQAVRVYFDALAARRPLVLVFDDIHWGEATFLDLIEHISDWSRGSPLLLVCVARPELLDVRPGWAGGKLNATTVLLEPLSDEQCSRLISNLMGESELAEDAALRIRTAADGNPLFVEEMLSMLIDEGRLVRNNGRWIAAGDLSTFQVPATIQALLAARLDQLGAREREAIERASVEGKLFHEGWVEDVTPEALRAQVTSQLATLLRKDLIRPEKPFFAGERAYHFRHLLIRDAAYESISKETRADLHERHADWLEPRVGERTVELEEILGYHLEQAYRYRTELGRIEDATRALGRRAAEWLGSAGRRAFARSDTPAAVNLVSRAIAVLPTGDPLRVDLVPNVRVIHGVSDLDWAEAVLNDAIASGDRRLEAHALVQRSLLRLFTAPDADPEELLEIAEDAIGFFEEENDQRGLARAWRLIAQVHYLRRCAEPSAGASARALTHAFAGGDRFEQREIVEWLGIALWLGSAPALEAAETCRRLLAEIPPDPVLEVNLLGALAYLVAIQDEAEDARAVIEKGWQVMQEVPEGSWVFPIEVGWIALWQGDPAATERELRERYGRLRGMNRSHFCSVAVVLAQAAYAQGRYEEADEYARAAVESADPIEVHSNIVGRSTAAKVLARRGAFEAAERLAQEAVAFAAESDFLDSHGTALTDFAEVLRLAGRADESVPVLEEAIELHERKGNVLAVEKIRALRANLA